MKKMTSIILALMLSAIMALPAFSASAAEPSKVEAQINGAVSYLYSNKTFGVVDSLDFLNIVRSGADVSNYIDAYTADVEKELKENGGKLYYPIPQYDADYNPIGNKDTEELELYAAVIEIYDCLGLDYTNVAGYNLADIMTNCGLTACNGSNYYYYRIITEACSIIDAPDSFVKAVMKNITSLYKMGEGTLFWGPGYSSADDLGAFVAALAPYASDYSDYISDATALIEKSYSDKGYTNFGNANADTTAYVLMAYSSISDDEMAAKAYDLLCLFESDETGVFLYGADKNTYATKDALMALGYYLPLTNTKDDTTEETTKPTTKPTTEPTTEDTTDKDESSSTTSSESTKAETSKPEKDESKTSPKTGNAAAVSAALVTAAGAVLLVASRRRK